MLYVKANQATTRNMTTNVFTEPYPLFHENDLGAFLLFCIKCYVSEANQAMNQKVSVDSYRVNHCLLRHLIRGVLIFEL